MNRRIFVSGGNRSPCEMARDFNRGAVAHHFDIGSCCQIDVGLFWGDFHAVIEFCDQWGRIFGVRDFFLEWSFL